MSTDRLQKVRDVVDEWQVAFDEDGDLHYNAMHRIAAILSAPEGEAPVAADADVIDLGNMSEVTKAKMALAIQFEKLLCAKLGDDWHPSVCVASLLDRLVPASPPKAATPPAVVGLTDAEIAGVRDSFGEDVVMLYAFARRIERAVWAKAALKTTPGG